MQEMLFDKVFYVALMAIVELIIVILFNDFKEIPLIKLEVATKFVIELLIEMTNVIFANNVATLIGLVMLMVIIESIISKLLFFRFVK